MTKKKPPAKPATKAAKKPAPKPAKKPAAKVQPGRPAGTSNRPYDEVTVQPSVCQQCGSAERSAYFGTPQVQEVQIEINGAFYNLCTWRRCKCESCGQHRFDKTFSYVEPEPQPTAEPESDELQATDDEGQDADVWGPEEE